MAKRDSAPTDTPAEDALVQSEPDPRDLVLADLARENALMRTILTVLCHQAGGSIRISRNEAILQTAGKELVLPTSLNDENNYLLAGSREQVLNLSMGL